MHDLCVSLVPVKVVFLRQNVVQRSEVVNEASDRAQSFEIFLRQHFSFHDALHVALFCSGAMSVHMLLLFLNGTFNITLTMVCAPPAFSTNKSRSV